MNLQVAAQYYSGVITFLWRSLSPLPSLCIHFILEVQVLISVEAHLTQSQQQSVILRERWVPQWELLLPWETRKHLHHFLVPVSFIHEQCNPLEL